MTEHDFGFSTDFYTFDPETLARELSDYRILREVGKGSMGIVYEAERKEDGRRVALKVLPPSLTLTDRALARFVKEREVMSRIEHPAIVRVFEHGQKGRLHYFAMEFVDGTTLEERVKIGPLPAKHAAEIGVEIAGALQYAHDHGVVHRDVKPGNVILAEDGRVVVTDFGLARETGTGSFTESGAIVGTPMYMAPEQILGHRSDIDSRADVYGLGATLFELLTGMPPFAAPTAQGVLRAVLEKDPPRPSRLRQDLPEDLEAILLRALEKRPSHRYGSAVEMGDDLRRYLNGERVLARVPNAAARLVRTAKRHPLLSLLILIIVALGIGSWVLYRDSQLTRLNEMVEQAELNYTKATSRQIRSLRAPTDAERVMYFDAALRLANGVLAEDPQNLRAVLTRALVHYRMEKWKLALVDFDRAEELAKRPREDILTYRIDTLFKLGDAASRRRLLVDLMSLLRLDKNTNTLCIVADAMLRMAAEITGPAARENILDRVDQVLARITEPSGPAAIARAAVSQLRGNADAARSAAAKACIDFPGDALVHEHAARIYNRLGDSETARNEASMARLLRGEEESTAGSQAIPGDGKRGSWDTESVRGWLQDLGQLFGREPTRKQLRDR